jgi:hypothetical protein
VQAGESIRVMLCDSAFPHFWGKPTQECLKPFCRSKSQPRKAPHLYDETLSVKNWRRFHKSKCAPFINPNIANFIEQFIELLLMNTVKQARSGNLDEMFDAI